jgi:CDP-diacylglycerol--glycerol-3-phosphate 3-phosphatidyltransferase
MVKHLPNTLTLVRLICALGLAGLLLLDSKAYYLAVFLYTVGALTELLDGQLAKKFDATSNFGSALNPLASRLLFYTPALLLLPLEILGVWMVWLLLARDLFVDSLKNYYLRKNTLLPPLISNKFKQISQSLLIILLFLLLLNPLLEGIARAIEVCMALTIGFALWSALTYLQYAFSPPKQPK